MDGASAPASAISAAGRPQPRASAGEEKAMQITPSRGGDATAFTASSSQRSAAASQQRADGSQLEKPRTSTAASVAASLAQIIPPLVQFIDGDLKRHLLHFMTRHEVAQLGRSSRQLTAETMNIDQWPLEMSTLSAGLKELQQQLLQYPQRRRMKQLQLSGYCDDVAQHLQQLSFLRLTSNFRTPAREAQGIHFRLTCNLLADAGYTKEEQAVWRECEDAELEGVVTNM
jgi:hypothetical protein